MTGNNMYRNDHSLGPLLENERAAILARAGAPGAAIEALGRLLAEPSPVNVPLLRMDPRWDPIRNDPRFQALLRRINSSAAPTKQ